MKPKKTKLLSLALGIMTAVHVLPARAALTDAELRAYVRNAWEVTSLTDDVISQYLDTSYSGIPFKNWIEGLLRAEEVSGKLSQKDYAGAAKEAAEFGADQAFDRLLEAAGLAGPAAVARLAAWPITLSLNQFVEAVKEGVTNFKTTNAESWANSHKYCAFIF